MIKMFHWATLKLTGSYLLILMTISLVFSSIIYSAATSEIDSQMKNLEQHIQTDISSFLSSDYDLTTLSYIQAHQAETNLLINLVYINLLFLAIGGIASYLLAKHTLEPIEKAHEAQSRFTSDASHELRTPLAAMKTELEVALRDPRLSRKEMKELLNSNLEEVNKLSQISQTLLTLSRLDHGGLELAKVAANDIVRRQSERLNLIDARISYTLPPRALYIKANAISIEELVTILLDNAIKYSPPKSKVNIKLSKSGKKARIDVSNKGSGISPEIMPYIFDRFYRADESRTGGEKTGAGLGLSLAKKIVELNNGDLKVSSEKGKRTVFTVLLPLYKSGRKSSNKLI